MPALIARAIGCPFVTERLPVKFSERRDLFSWNSLLKTGAGEPAVCLRFVPEVDGVDGERAQCHRLTGIGIEREAHQPDPFGLPAGLDIHIGELDVRIRLIRTEPD